MSKGNSKIKEQRLDNYKVKNLSCRDQGYQMFVSSQMNDLNEHHLNRYDYLKTHLSRAGIQRRNDYETDQIMAISKKIKNIYSKKIEERFIDKKKLQDMMPQNHSIQMTKKFFPFRKDVDEHVQE